MPKDLLFRETARQSMFRGVEKLGEAVSLTIGPKGRNVIIEQGLASPLITNDGVTIAKSITLPNRYENMGAKLVMQAANQTNEVAGDGTTTATLLTYTMIREGMKYLTSGANAVSLRAGINHATDFVVGTLKDAARKVQTEEEIAQVASISSADKEIGKLIAQAMERVGREGSITMETSQGFHTELEITEGVSYDKGYISPYFVKDRERMETVLHNPYILITNHQLSTTNDILGLLESIVEEDGSLLVIAEDVEGEALATLATNAMQGVLKAVAIKAPGFGERKKELLEDIAVITGGTYFSTDLGMSLADVTIDKLGCADKVIVQRGNTIIMGGHAEEGAVEARINELTAGIETTISELDKNKMIERRSKLNGAVAVIKVGAATETEMIERKLRIEDALNATRAAVEEGIVIGGGMALYKAYDKLREYMATQVVEHDEMLGMEIVAKAIHAPISKIIENAGQNEGYVLSSLANEKEDYGYDALTKKNVNMFKEGIIDPVKVTRSALQNAASIASLFLTADAAIAELPEDHKEVDVQYPIGQTNQFA